jgi:hypothetical protein
MSCHWSDIIFAINHKITETPRHGGIDRDNTENATCYDLLGVAHIPQKPHPPFHISLIYSIASIHKPCLKYIRCIQVSGNTKRMIDGGSIRNCSLRFYLQTELPNTHVILRDDAGHGFSQAARARATSPPP